MKRGRRKGCTVRCEWSVVWRGRAVRGQNDGGHAKRMRHQADGTALVVGGRINGLGVQGRGRRGSSNRAWLAGKQWGEGGDGGREVERECVCVWSYDRGHYPRTYTCARRLPLQPAHHSRCLSPAGAWRATGPWPILLRAVVPRVCVLI